MSGYFGGLTDHQALVRIHDVMSGEEWSADTLDHIADILGLTEVGRPADTQED